MKRFATPLMDFVLSPEPQRRLRMSMSLLAVALAVLGTLVLVCAAHLGLAPMQPVLLWAAVTLSGFVLMSALVRLGLTEHWTDPALTFAQILWATTACAAAYVVAGEMRESMAGMLVVAVLFASLDLNRRQTIFCALYGFAAYCAAVAWHSAQVQLDSQARLVQAAQVAVLAITLMASVMLSLRLSTLRERLRQRKHELQRALRANQELASRDALTGLFNRRHMSELMEIERLRCVRGPRVMTIAQLDLDHFKAINDTYGHAAGDAALQTFSVVVQANLRVSDVLARWGGEEFVLMLTDTHAEASLAVLHRIREALAASVVHVPQLGTLGCGTTLGERGQPPYAQAITAPQLRITVSIGAAQHMVGESIEATLARADRALYRAKAAGRNRVELACADEPASNNPQHSPS